MSKKQESPKSFTYRIFTVRFSSHVNILLLTTLISSCALPTRPSEQLKPSDETSSAAMHAALIDSSQSLFDDQLELQNGLIKREPVLAAQSLEAIPDALGGKSISMSMQNARIGQLLWILAKDYGLSLSIDPPVLDMAMSVNLYLQQVTVRQALDSILKAFDVTGNVGEGGILAVKMSEERVFNLEILTSRSSLELTAGGDSFGGKSTETGMKNNLSVKSEVGDKTDAFDSIVKMVELLLKEGEAAGGAAPTKDGREPARMSVNRSSGTMYVRARPSQMRFITELIQRESAFRQEQVQIDAQILDVALNNDSRFGIDWTLFGTKIAAQFGSSPINIAGAAIGGNNSATNLVGRVVSIPAQSLGFGGGVTSGGAGYRNDKFSVALSALRQFGSVRVLSNPSVLVRNGMPAYLNVGNSIRYVQKVTSTTNNAQSGSTTSVDVVTDSVFSGVVVGVSAIVKKDGTIEVFIQPSQTQVSETSLVPVDVGGGNKVTLPRVNSKSLATTLNIRSGDTVVIGGLIDRQDYGTVSGVPGAMDIPGVGRAFSTELNQDSARELVVVLRARATQ